MDDVLPAVLGVGSFVLRSWRPDEASALDTLVSQNLDRLLPWMPWARDEPMREGERRELIEAWEQGRRDGGDAVYAMTVDGAVVGNCGLHHRIGPGGLEIGYWVTREQTRLGYASAAARLLTEAGFDCAAVDHVEIHHDAANVASSGVPQRLGYDLAEKRVGGPGAVGDTGVVWVWRVTRDNWASRPPRETNR